MSRRQFYSFFLLYAAALLYLVITLPMGPHEAKVYYESKNILYALTHFYNGWFENGLAFRLPFLFFGLANIPLFFIISKSYFRKVDESYLASAIFAMLPGIITASVLVNIGVIVITLVLAFLILYEKRRVFLQAFVMILLLLIHDASIIFFISLSIFSAFKRDKLLFSFSIILAAISLIYFNELNIGGRPSGEFMKLFALYMALFSPLVFIYFFYALYRIWLREKKDILWYISFTAFSLSILLSLRQQVKMTDFAPYVIVAVVLMVLIYYRTVNVRLPQFQKSYRLGFNIVMVSLLLTSSSIIFHQLLFFILKDNSKHFAYSFYEPYWRVSELKKTGQNCYTANRKKVQYQLKYYGIEECQDLDVSKIHK